MKKVKGIQGDFREESRWFFRKKMSGFFVKMDKKKISFTLKSEGFSYKLL